MLSSADIKTEVQQPHNNNSMEEDEDEEEEGVDPLDPPSSSAGLLGPVQDVPEDLSLKKEVIHTSGSTTAVNTASSSSSSTASSPHLQQQQHGFKTNISRSSSSPSSEGSNSGEPSKAKRVKPIPPPLDLNARTLYVSEAFALPLPASPLDLPRESLPIRKRAVVKDEDLRYNPLHVGPSPLRTALTPTSTAPYPASTHFPVPPPLIPYPKSPFLPGGGSGGFPTPPTDPLHSPGFPWASPTLTALGMLPAFSPAFPPPTSPHPFPHSSASSCSSLLTPSPSYHSSSSSASSREELMQHHHHHHFLSHHAAAAAAAAATSSSLLLDKKPMLTAPTPRYGPIPSLMPSSGASAQGPPRVLPDSSSPAPPSSSSPMLSPRTWSHSWPTPVWQCFVAGVQVQFLLPSTDTPWQKAEELGWKDRIAMKVDSRNPYQYAPNGLTLTKMELVSSGDEENALLLRMSPHNVPDMSRVDMLAECPLDHPFFVKDKGWCSAQPRLSLEKYGIPCKELSIGDICLPPNHPEAIRTPDLCDRFKRFEFSSHDLSDQLSPSPGGPRSAGSGNPNPPLRHGIASILPAAVRTSAANDILMSPPMSPARKKSSSSSDADRAKRPMNGFMLFAKKYRLELIQQHPGKDNRAISVLLGEAWKSLPMEDREQYSQKAKVLADEQKKLHPDCWKRKRSLNPAGGAGGSQSAGPSPAHHHHHGAPSQQGSMPGTPTSHFAFFPHHAAAAAAAAYSSLSSLAAGSMNPG